MVLVLAASGASRLHQCHSSGEPDLFSVCILGYKQTFINSSINLSTLDLVPTDHRCLEG